MAICRRFSYPRPPFEMLFGWIKQQIGMKHWRLIHILMTLPKTLFIN